jgi:uncharacterized protein (TIGR02145 family)
MKKMTQIYAMAFVSIAAIAGCQQEIIDSYEGDNIKKVYASLEESSETKTSLNDKEVFWSSDDRIAVFLKNTLRKRFDITPESAGSKKGTFLYDSDYIVTGNNVKIPNNIAYYPFSDVICTRNGDLYIIDNVSLPETQSYVPESFGEESFPMLAVTNDIEDVDFAFRNVCGALAFQLKGSGKIRSISLQGNSEELLSGKAVITAALGENPKISLLPEGNKTVTLDCGAAGVELKNDISTSFFFTLPPVDFKNGFTITVTDINGGTEEYSTSRENSILRSTILRMPEKEYIGTNTSLDHDYVDEYGVNHGPGVEIDGVVWAPVNCGYHKDDFKYGKLYQWGRKYGQGYSGEFWDWNFDSSFDFTYSTYSDSTIPENIPATVSLSEVQSQHNENKFYYMVNSPWDWCSPPNGTLWNSGTEMNPMKTEYDPCPLGWRIPTYAEIEKLSMNYSSFTCDDKDRPGRWFTGSTPYTATVSQLFLPAAGLLYCRDGYSCNRGIYGYYWSSGPSINEAYELCFHSSYNPSVYTGYRAGGQSVRCVQE